MHACMYRTTTISTYPNTVYATCYRLYRSDTLMAFASTGVRCSMRARLLRSLACNPREGVHDHTHTHTHTHTRARTHTHIHTHTHSYKEDTQQHQQPSCMPARRECVRVFPHTRCPTRSHRTASTQCGTTQRPSSSNRNHLACQ